LQSSNKDNRSIFEYRHVWFREKKALEGPNGGDGAYQPGRNRQGIWEDEIAAPDRGRGIQAHLSDVVRSMVEEAMTGTKSAKISISLMLE